MTDYWVKSGTGGDDSGSSWANAAESIAGLITAQALAPGDTIYVHNTHNYTANAAISWQIPESGSGLVQILCVDGGDPTGASLSGVGNLTTGARESTGGAYAFTITPGTLTSAQLFIHGITIESGSSSTTSGSADILIGSSNSGHIIFSSCTFYIYSTSTSAQIIAGITTGGFGHFIYRNCIFKFTATGSGQCYLVNSGWHIFENCNCGAGVAPASLFQSQISARAIVLCSSCDWSNSTVLVNQTNVCMTYFSFVNCAITTPITGTHGAAEYPIVECRASAAADGTNGADILAYYFESGLGIIEDDQTIYLTTGSAQGTQDDGTATSYSLKMQPTSLVAKALPLYTPWIYKKVTSTGDKTITMKACDAGTDADELHTSELWLEVEYMGEPGVTGTQRVADSPMSILEVDDDCPVQSGTIYRDVTAAGADRTDTDEAWTGITETNTYTLTASVNLAEQGYIRCRVGLAFDRDVYVDPKIGVA